MFYSCNSLTSLDLSNFITIKVTNMAQMFYEINSMNILDISNFETTNCKNVNGIFDECKNNVTVILNSKKCANIYDIIPEYFSVEDLSLFFS